MDDYRPRLVFWELTRGCNLRCIHCRASATELSSPDDLSYGQCLHVIDQLAEFAPFVLVLSGGEPLFRRDLLHLVSRATERGIRVALATNGTLVTQSLAGQLAMAGVQRVAISLDGPDASTHDSFRGVPGAFDAALGGFEHLKRAGISLQINTTVAKHNAARLPETLELAVRLGADAFHLFLLVPVGCGIQIADKQMVEAEEYERILNWLYDRTLENRIELKATCAPHFFRVVRQRRADARRRGEAVPELPAHRHGGRPATAMNAVTRGCLAGTGVCFISHRGDVYPCGYLPLSAGHLRAQSFGSIWRDSPLFASLRDPNALKGKCGVCEFRNICEGCRARAFGCSGDYLAEEPFCQYTPASSSASVRPNRKRLPRSTDSAKKENTMRKLSRDSDRFCSHGLSSRAAPPADRKPGTFSEAMRTIPQIALASAICYLLFVIWLFASWPVQAQKPSPTAQQPSPSQASQPAVGGPADSMDMNMNMDMGDMHMDANSSTAPDQHAMSSDDHPDDDMADMPGMAGMAGHEHGHGTPTRSLVLALFLATVAIACALLVFARGRLRHQTAEPTRAPVDLLALPVLGKALRSRYFLGSLLAPTILIFGAIVLVGLFGEQNTGNPAVLLTWILWWPAVIFTFFLLGRIWCSFCPFGYLGDVAQRVFSLRRKVPQLLRTMWWRLGCFLALTWITSLWALDRWPRGTAWLALALTLGSISLAVIFEKRVFCRYVCPVGGIFGLYSMAAPLRLTVKDRKVCREKCTDKNCFQSCSWFQFPPTMERGAECSLCLDCARACPHHNIALQTQPFAEDLADFRPRRKSLDEATTIAAVLGVSLFQTAVMLNIWHDWQPKIGTWLHIGSGWLLYTTLFLALGVLIPLLLLGLTIRLAGAAQGTRCDFFASLRTYAYCFLPLGLGLHAAHNFHHLFGEGGAMLDGVRKAVAQYTGWSSLAPTQSLSLAMQPNTLFVLQWLALMGGLFLSVRVAIAVARRNASTLRQSFRAVLPILLFAAAYTLLNVLVLSASMAHRH